MDTLRTDWSRVERAIQINDKKPTIYSKVLRKATELNDEDMPIRLNSVPNSDLVAIEARYHRRKACLMPNQVHQLLKQRSTIPAP